MSTAFPVDRIVVDRVGKTFRSRRSSTVALAGASLEIERGEFVTLIGRSGCGKSTLLRMIAGLVVPDSGTVSIFGETPEEACEAKEIGFVPQSPALLPWRSVLHNVTLPLELNRGGPGEERVAGRDPVAILEALGLGEVLDKRPSELSGGMAQRVAIARAFCFGPSILLMDEPFSALDELTREVLQRDLLEQWQKEQQTVLFVTHSVTEAVLLSDRVLVMAPESGPLIAEIRVELPRPRPELIECPEEFRELERSVRLALAGRANART